MEETLLMKPPKIEMIVGKHGALIGSSIREDRGVVNSLVGSTGLLHR